MQNPMRNNTRLGGHLSERDEGGSYSFTVRGFYLVVIVWAVVTLMA